MRRIRLGIVGANRQGREHVVSADDVEIVGACDPNDDVRARFGRDFPSIPCFALVDELCRHTQPDGLIVAVPHHVGPSIWPSLLREGLPLLKEKPLGRTLAEAQGLVAQAHHAGVPVVTAIQRRTHPSYVRLAEALRGQRILSLSATLHLGFDPAQPNDGWRGSRALAGGGALLDSGYHMVDLAQHLLGPLSFVHAVVCRNGVPAGPSDIETEAVVVARAGPAWARIESRVGGRPAAGGGFQKFEQVVVEAEDAVFRADRRSVHRGEESLFECAPDWRDGMEAQLERFAGMIRTGRFDEPVVWDQMAAMRLIDRAYVELGRFGRFLGDGASR